MATDFTDIGYLKAGTPLQQQAYNVLVQHQIMEKLAAYTSLLCGTIPINIALTGSDLDIICQWQNKETFITDITTLFAGYEHFSIRENNAIDAVIASFVCDGFPIEVFGQSIPTTEQNAYRHMIIEHEILLLKGEAFRNEIIILKQQAYKTEPAFAKLLGLEGNPYTALLHYKI
nr:DUF4269 domain-containing protein [uncultured Flavobacterium sp.]